MFSIKNSSQNMTFDDKYVFLDILFKDSKINTNNIKTFMNKINAKYFGENGKWKIIYLTHDNFLELLKLIDNPFINFSKNLNRILDIKLHSCANNFDDINNKDIAGIEVSLFNIGNIDNNILNIKEIFPKVKIIKESKVVYLFINSFSKDIYNMFLELNFVFSRRRYGNFIISREE